MVLVTYDISLEDLSGQRRLRKVARVCSSLGVRVQNSVFECRIDATQYVKLKHDIEALIDTSRDSVRFYQLGNSFSGKIEHIGVRREVDLDEPMIF